MKKMILVSVSLIVLSIIVSIIIVLSLMAARKEKQVVNEDRSNVINNLNYFDIFYAIQKLTFCGQPGKLVISGGGGDGGGMTRSHALLYGNTSSEVFMATGEYGRGRVVVVSHDCVLKWFSSSSDQYDEKQFTVNVLKWLAMSDDSDMIKSLLVQKSQDFDAKKLTNYDVILWDGNTSLGNSQVDLLKMYLSLGGSLFIAISPTTNKKKNLELKNFLEETFGISLSDEVISLPEEIVFKQVNINYDSNSSISLAYLEILFGLKYVPFSGIPGKLIVASDNAQPVFNAYNDDVFLVAAKYGRRKGKVFLAAHNSYINLLTSEQDLEKNFMDNVKKWLTNRINLDNLKILDLQKSYNSYLSINFMDYDIVLWPNGIELADEGIQKLLNYLNEGGSLFCALTPWATYNLEQSSVFNFFKVNFKVLFTWELINGGQSPFLVKNNLAKYSNAAYTTLSQIDFSRPDIFKYLSSLPSLYNNELLLNSTFLQSVCYDVQTYLKDNRRDVLFFLNKGIPLGSQKRLTQVYLDCLRGGTIKSKALGIDVFPGDYTVLPQLLQSIEIHFESRFEELLSTGYYLPAGVEMTIEIIKGDFTRWGLQIGSHTDQLYHFGSLERLPVVFTREYFKSNVTVTYSPFGGLVYLLSPQSGGGGTLTIKLSNVVVAPFYDLTQPDVVQQWPTRRNAPGLWSELSGKYVIFTGPSESVRHIQDPQPIVEFWDRVIELLQYVD